MCTVCNPCKKQDSERTGPAFSSSCGICHWSWEVPSFLRSGIKQLRSSGFCLLRCGGSAPSHAGKAGRYAPVPRGFGCASLFPYVRFAFLFRGLSSFVISLPPRFSLPCLPFRFPPLCFRRPCTFSLPARFSCVCPCSPGKMPSYIAGARDALYPCFFRRIV